jgi:hypothetical protein
MTIRAFGARRRKTRCWGTDKRAVLEKCSNNFQNIAINMVIKLTLLWSHVSTSTIAERKQGGFFISRGESTYEQIEHGRDRVYNQMPERK